MILVDFGCQVGVQNQPKIDQKWHRKNDGKKKGSKMAKKTIQEPTVPSDQEGARLWGGHILICGVNPALARRDGGEMVPCLGCLS